MCRGGGCVFLGGYGLILQLTKGGLNTCQGRIQEFLKGGGDHAGSPKRQENASL